MTRKQQMKDEQAARQPMTRRDFLERCIAGLVAVAGIAGVTGICTYLQPVEEGTWGAIEVARADEIPVGQGITVPFKGTTVLVLHLEKGFVAFSAVCTHAGCLVQWNPEQQRIICPCHDGLFDTEGNVISGLPPRSLPKYRVAAVGGKLMLAEG